MATAPKPQFNAALLLEDARAIGMDRAALIRVSGKSRWTLDRFLEGSIQTTKSNEAFAWAVRQSPERYVIAPKATRLRPSRRGAVQSRKPSQKQIQRAS